MSTEVSGARQSSDKRTTRTGQRVLHQRDIHNKNEDPRRSKSVGGPSPRMSKSENN